MVILKNSGPVRRSPLSGTEWENCIKILTMTDILYPAHDHICSIAQRSTLYFVYPAHDHICSIAQRSTLYFGAMTCWSVGFTLSKTLLPHMTSGKARVGSKWRTPFNGSCNQEETRAKDVGKHYSPPSLQLANLERVYPPESPSGGPLGPSRKPCAPINCLNLVFTRSIMLP